MATFNFGAPEIQSQLADRGPVGPLPKGEYIAVITDITVGEFSPTSASGKAGLPKVTVQLKVAEGDFKGRKVTHWTLNGHPLEASGKVNYKLAGLLKALGFDLNGDVTIPETEEEWGEFVNEEVGVLLSYADPDSQGRVFNQIDNYKPADEVTDTPTADTEVVLPTASAAPRRGGASSAPAPAGRTRPSRGGGLNF